MKDEFDSALRDSYSKNKEIARRSTLIRLNYSKGKVTESYTHIYEYLPPDKSRWTNIIEKQNTPAVRNESITIGDKTYNKKNQEKWELEDKSAGSGGGSGISGTPLKTVDCWQFMMFSGELNNQPATQYFSYRVSNIRDVLYFFEDRNWINPDGLILKKTTKQSSMIPENVTSTSTTVYEYNPKNLIIEAPIVK